MPKLILRCNYLKNSPPAHLANYINYIGTREGVEKVSSTTSSLPATDRQKNLIADILAKIPDANRMHEYHDYIQRPTRENASEFITQALENNLDIIAKKKNYMDYLANRPQYPWFHRLCRPPYYPLPHRYLHLLLQQQPKVPP